jgi:hypothetical protein
MDLPDKPDKATTFKRLIDEVIAGEIRRSRFDPWEIGVLLDLLRCDLSAISPTSRLRILREYQEAASLQLEEGADDPLTLSKYLESVTVPRRRTTAAQQRSRVAARKRYASGSQTGKVRTRR